MSDIRLIEASSEHYELLYDLLKVRWDSPDVNITWRASDIPSYKEHVEFLDSKPYKGIYIIENTVPIGMIALNRENFITIVLYPQYTGFGYGPKAVRELAKLHSEEIYASINPNNYASRKMLEGIGFKEVERIYEYSFSSS